MIALSFDEIDPVGLYGTFAAGVKSAGAIVTFTGSVRSDGERDVLALVLDHAPGLTDSEIAAAAAATRKRWSLIDLMIVHRVGKVGVGEAIVFVAAAAAHRRPAFEACDFLVDYLKTDAPFWKKEIRRTAEEWIEPTGQDYIDRDRWR